MARPLINLAASFEDFVKRSEKIWFRTNKGWASRSITSEDKKELKESVNAYTEGNYIAKNPEAFADAGY